jgi:hypothetical protein
LVTALSNMAAANRSPGIGDARVPCPLCGGLIHPVAGRCKHCKEDLSSLRAGKPQAATPLPALNQAAPPPQHLRVGHVEAAVVAGTNGHAAAAPIAVPARADASQPILPPRPTSQWRMKAQRPRSLAKNWPLIVIILAVLAIVAAVVIMVWPQDDAHHGGKKRLMAPPAPDRMETDPLGKHSQVDPWGQPDDPGALGTPAPDDDDSMAQGGTVPRRTPDPPNAPPPNDPDDLFGGLGGGPSSGLAGTFMLTMLDKACKKLQTCPSSDQATLAAACSSLSMMPKPPAPANCASAQRCLDAIDALDCDAGIDNPVSAISLIQDCSKAMTECT